MAPNLRKCYPTDRNRVSYDSESKGDSRGSWGHWAEECLAARCSTGVVELSASQGYGMLPSLGICQDLIPAAYLPLRLFLESLREIIDCSLMMLFNFKNCMAGHRAFVFGELPSSVCNVELMLVRHVPPR
eukprot:2306587-Amphidinium_carterae.1